MRMRLTAVFFCHASAHGLSQNVQFPEKGLVYDYYVDEANCCMVPWEDKVQKFQYFPGENDLNLISTCLMHAKCSFRNT